MQNLNKHGIDFVQAQQLWRVPNIEFAANSEFENRYAMIGLFAGKIYTCIYTIRNDKVRIISCRRARENEVKLYEKNV